MALLTSRSKLAVMGVLMGMASNARGSNKSSILILGCWARVASLTGHLAMCALQPVGVPAVVIKIPNRPGTVVMTVFAAHSELLFVFVFIFMTRKAIVRCIFVTECFVTILTRRRDMAPCQRKAGS